MNNHPVNLGLRFLLELLALYLVGYWGYTKGVGVSKYLLMIALPVMMATIWGVFRVPGDPGNAPVAVNGIIRLIIEAVVFGSAVYVLFDIGRSKYGWALLVILLIHYAVSYDRIMWLLRR